MEKLTIKLENCYGIKKSNMSLFFYNFKTTVMLRISMKKASRIFSFFIFCISR